MFLLNKLGSIDAVRVQAKYYGLQNDLRYSLSTEIAGFTETATITRVTGRGNP